MYKSTVEWPSPDIFVDKLLNRVTYWAGTSSTQLLLWEKFNNRTLFVVRQKGTQASLFLTVCLAFQHVFYKKCSVMVKSTPPGCCKTKSSLKTGRLLQSYVNHTCNMVLVFWPIKLLYIRLINLLPTTSANIFTSSANLFTCTRWHSVQSNHINFTVNRYKHAVSKRSIQLAKLPGWQCKCSVCVCLLKLRGHGTSWLYKSLSVSME